MAVVDTLEVQVKSQADEAIKSLDKLVSRLKSSQKVLDGFKKNTSGISELSKQFNQLNKSINKLNFGVLKRFSESINGMKLDSRKVNSLVGNLNSLAGIDSRKLIQLGIGLKNLNSGLRGLCSSNVDTRNITNIVRAISTLANSDLSKIDTNKIKEVGQVLKDFSDKLATARSIDRSITSMVMAISRLAGVADGIPKVTTSLGAFGAELKKFTTTMSSADKVATETIQFTQAIAQLANSGNRITTVISNLEPLSKALINFFNVMQNAPSIANSTLQFTQAIAQLANAGNSSSSINGLSNSFNTLGVSASNTQGILGNLVMFMKNIGIGYASIAQGSYTTVTALAKMTYAAINVKFGLISSADASNIFKEQLQRLKTGALTLVSGFGTLLKSLINLKNVFVSVGNKISRLKGIFSSYGSSATGIIRHNSLIQSSFNKLTSAIGLFYARYFLVMRAVKLIFKATESSMDYVETYNFYNVALNKMGHDAQSTANKVGSKTGEKLTDSIKQAVSDGTNDVVDESKKLVEKTADEVNKKIDNVTENKMSTSGKKSAREYADSFKSEINTLTQKMTGFKIDDSGALVDTGTIGLGLDPEQLMNFQAKILSITNSVGMMGNVSTMTSKALSMLSSDLSSLTNTDLDTVMDNLTSGLIGQSRALYKYGIDITNTTLAELAATEGIKKKVSKMTQQEKMQLRILAILRQSKISWADQANRRDIVLIGVA